MRGPAASRLFSQDFLFLLFGPLRPAGGRSPVLRLASAIWCLADSLVCHLGLHWIGFRNRRIERQCRRRIAASLAQVKRPALLRAANARHLLAAKRCDTPYSCAGL